MLTADWWGQRLESRSAVTVYSNGAVISRFPGEGNSCGRAPGPFLSSLVLRPQISPGHATTWTQTRDVPINTNIHQLVLTHQRNISSKFVVIDHICHAHTDDVAVQNKTPFILTSVCFQTTSLTDKYATARSWVGEQCTLKEIRAKYRYSRTTNHNNMVNHPWNRFFGL